MRTLFLLSFLCSISVANSQTIENIDFHAEGQTIVATYDLIGCVSNEHYSVGLEFVRETGEKVIPKTLSGDLSSLLCGSKRIVWDIFKDRSSFEGKYQVHVSFKSISKIPIDPDGYEYKTVEIGDQVWIAENLRTSKYNDGTLIKYVTDPTEWSQLSTGAYCFYENNVGNNDIYGKLYNFYAVDTKKLCPVGWHVPSDEEWTKLIIFLGEENTAASKMKSTSGWSDFNGKPGKCTNESGLSVLPGGSRSTSGAFSEIGDNGNWWSYTEYLVRNAWYRYLYYNYFKVYRDVCDKGYGLSVRCLRD